MIVEVMNYWQAQAPLKTLWETQKGMKGNFSTKQEMYM